MKNIIYLIYCKKCENWEQLPPDTQRWHAQAFKHKNGNKFLCDCGNTVIGELGQECTVCNGVGLENGKHPCAFCNSTGFTPIQSS